MNDAWVYMTAIERVLEQETALLLSLYAGQKRLSESVVARDWRALESEIHLCSSLADKFNEIEQERLDLVTNALGQKEALNGFYRLTSFFPDADRTRINALYREVKRLLLLCRTESEVFTSYVSNAKSLLSGMFDTVLSGGAGKVYTKSGNLASRTLDSVVLNRSF